MKILKGIRSEVLKAVLYGVYLFIVVFILLEVLLRLYDPFKFRLKANRIILPVNHKEIISNTINPRLDSVILVTRNSLGFRGPDTSEASVREPSIITIGGSTTECHFLSNHKTWPYLLGENLKKYFPNIFVNNAGFDGHSTYGHHVLLNDHVKSLKPNVVIFLTGVNDIENDGPSYFDKLKTRNTYPDLRHFVYNNSEVVNAIVNILRGRRATELNNTTHELIKPGSLGTLKTSREQIRLKLKKQEKYLAAYEERLSALVDTCKRNNILPVLFTQPCLYGYGIDSLTGADLATAKVEDSMNGVLVWSLVEMYNARVRNICKSKSVPLIDIAALMPKNSLYYYDQTHFTNEGAAMLAQIASEKMTVILERRH